MKVIFITFWGKKAKTTNLHNYQYEFSQIFIFSILCLIQAGEKYEALYLDIRAKIIF